MDALPLADPIGPDIRLRAYELPSRVPPATLAQYESEYHVVLTNPPHSHTVPATRLRLEALIASSCVSSFLQRRAPGGCVVSVGGSPRPGQDAAADDVWTNVESSQGVMFDSVGLPPNGPAHCSHRADLCQCRVADVSVFNHTLHLYSPEEVASVVMNSRRRLAMVITHRYPDIAGSLYDEASWYRESPERVRLVYRGLTETISRDACDWIDTPQFVASTSQGTPVSSMVVYTLVASIGLTHVYSVHLENIIDHPVVYPGTTDPDPWQSAMLNEPPGTQARSYALTSGAPNGPKKLSFDWYSFGYQEVRLLPGLVIMTGPQTQPVLMSRAILYKTFVKFLWRPREVSSFQAMQRYVMQQYNEVDNLPEELKYSAVMGTVLLALSEAPVAEFSSLAEVNRACKRLWASHATAARLEAPTMVSKWDIVAGAAWAALSATTLHQVVAGALHLPWAAPPKTANAVAAHSLGAASLKIVSAKVVAATVAVHAVPLAPVWIAATTAGCIYGAVKRWDLTGAAHRARSVTAWAETPPGHAPPPLQEGVYPLDVAPIFGPTDRVKPMVRTLSATTLVTPAPIEPPRKETKKLSALGIVMSATMPTYFGSSAENELVAFTNRLGRPRVAQEAGLWHLVGQMYRNHPFQKYRQRLITEEPVVVNNRNVQDYASKMPRSLQIALVSAFHEWEETMHLSHADRVTSLFIKIEKALKQHVEMGFVEYDDNEEGTPRAIISMKPKLSALFGTIVHQVSRRDRDAILNAEEGYNAMSPICPYGVCAEVMGDWLSYWIEELGGIDAVWFYDGDLATCDGNQSGPAMHEAHQMLFNVCDIRPAQAREVLNVHRVTTGHSHGGVKYRFANKMASGVSDTSATTTETTRMAQLACLETPVSDDPLIAPLLPANASGLGVHYAVAAGGDDEFGIVKKSWAVERFGTIPRFIRQRERVWAALGHSNTTHVSSKLCEVDFLSKLWYPVGASYLLGGKIGRTLSRAGWFLDCKDEQTIRGAALSAFQDNAHVPFLREYFQRVIELTAGQKVKGRTHEYAVHTREAHAYDQNTLAFVEERYGLTKHDLDTFTALLAAVRSVPVVVSWDRYESLFARDNA